MTFICWAGAIAITKAGEREKTPLLWATALICLGILVIFKYTGFLMSTAFSILPISGTVPSIALPIGISFYTFQLVSYVIDVRRGEVGAQTNYFTLLLYASLFHQCIAGPIVRYADVNYDIENRIIKREEVSAGITRFSVGLAKKALLANGCGAICDGIFNNASGAALSAAEISRLSSGAILLGCFAFMLQIYLDFSAYSDMAIGMGLMVGFHYKENFNYPYVADSVTDFWRRWHISLSSFFRDYVYIPLGGNRMSIPRHILNMLVVWALTGFWHGANWNFILWGLFFFVFLIVEKYLIKPKKNPKIWWKIPRILLTQVIVYVSFMLFKFTDLSAFWQSFIGILNIPRWFSEGFGDAQTLMTLKNNVFFIIISVLACTPIIPAVTGIMDRTEITKKARAAVGVAIPVLLLVLSAFALAGDSYNPFLYFQF
jgi:alginate O-acetyltransferase complex protein AlgI